MRGLESEGGAWGARCLLPAAQQEWGALGSHEDSSSAAAEAQGGKRTDPKNHSLEMTELQQHQPWAPFGDGTKGSVPGQSQPFFQS